MGWGGDQKWNDDDECLINVQSLDKNELYASLSYSAFDEHPQKIIHIALDLSILAWMRI